LTLEGGVPELNVNNDYTAAVTINGTTTLVQVSSGGTFGTLPISLSNGDTWSVEVYDGIGCDTASVASTIFNAVDAIATTDATVDLLVGQTASIDASQSTGTNLTYQWTPMTGANVNGGTDFTAVTTTVQPLETTTYTVLITDNLGCTDIDSVEVPVGRCVPLHAGFTPNDDGTNDFWTIPCLDLFNNRVEVYNRWGQLVYTKDNYDGTWDGTNNGQALPDAAYYYVITVTFPNLVEPVIYKGTVTIIR